MELFSISCTTCQKRLKVRETSAIGEILICPSCGSMVLVEAPEGWIPPAGDPPVESEAVTQPPSLDEPPQPEAAGEPSPAPPSVAMPEAQETDESCDESQDASKEPPLMTQAGAEPEAPPAEFTADSETPIGDGLAPPLLPNENWISPSLQRRQQVLMLGVSAVVGIGMAMILLGIIAARNAKAPPESVQDPADASVAAESQNRDPRVTQDQADPSAARAASHDATSASPDAAADATASSDEPGGNDSKSDPDGMAATKVPASEPDGEPEDATSAQNPEAEPGTEPPSRDSMPTVAEGHQPPKPPAGQTPDTSALTNTLEAFAPFIQDETYVAPNTPEEAQAGQPEMNASELDEGDLSVPRPEPREVIVAERLKDTIPELDIPQMPLVSFVHFLTGFSTIPISLDPDALALLKIKPDRPVAIKMVDGDVGEILNAAIQPLGLAAVQVGQQLWLTRPRPTDGQLRSHRHSVGDLVGTDQEQLDELAEWITTMIEPDSWETHGGPGVLRTELPDLVLQHQDTTLFRVLLFCERLRMARGLATKTNLDPNLCRLETRSSRIQSLLQKPIRIRYVEPTSMMQILERVTRETGLQILVDWQAIGRLGWTPDAETMFVAENVSLGEALTNMLRPMDLTYRAIDTTTIQITSPEADENRWDVEFYPVDGLFGDSTETTPLLGRLREALKKVGVGESDGVLHIDPVSRHLIAALAQPEQRQLTVILQRWPPEEP